MRIWYHYMDDWDDDELVTCDPDPLEKLCYEICDKKNASAIFRRLWNAEIMSIDDLKRYNLETLSRIPGMGALRLEYIKEMKLAIGDTNI